VLSCDSNDPKTISASATSYRNESGELVVWDATKAEIESIDRFYERIQKIEKKYPAPPIPLNQETFAVSSINEDGVFILGILGTGIDILIDKMGFCGYLNGHATKSQNWCCGCAAPYHSSRNRTPENLLGRWRSWFLCKATEKGVDWDAHRLFCMGFDSQSHPPLAAYGPYTDQRGHEQTFDGICCTIQSATSASWSSFSESIQVDFVPGRSLFNGVGPLHPPEPIACQTCGEL